MDAGGQRSSKDLLKARDAPVDMVGMDGERWCAWCGDPLPEPRALLSGVEYHVECAARRLALLHGRALLRVVSSRPRL